MPNNALPLSVVKVSGDDATTFLQGQLTQDMASINQQWNYAAQCNPQGRVIAFFIALQLDNDIFLLTDSETCEQTIEQLQKYVMRSQVTFEPLDQHVYFIPRPETDPSDNEEKQELLNSVDHNENTITLHQKQGQLVITDQEPEDASDINHWRKTNIAGKVPHLTKKAHGSFTPEAINLDLLGAVSFTKGCYTGQEIVARMHYLGKAKKRVFVVKIMGNLEQIQVSDNITDSEGKTIGHLVDYEPSGNALISIKTTLEGSLIRNKHILQSINGELLL